MAFCHAGCKKPHPARQKPPLTPLDITRIMSPCPKALCGLFPTPHNLSTSPAGRPQGLPVESLRSIRKGKKHYPIIPAHHPFFFPARAEHAPGTSQKARYPSQGTKKPERGARTWRSAAPITCRSSAPGDGRRCATKYFYPGTARDCLDVGRYTNGRAVGTFY